MLNDSIEDKMPALINYVQMGIDFYGIFKAGGSWSGSGGQGRKLPITFAAVLLNNQEMKNAVSGAGKGLFVENTGAQYSEIAGGALYTKENCSESMYWAKLNDNSASGSKACRDPYGYIDGGQNPGKSYLFCCFSQPWKATSLSVRLMPEMRAVWNDESFHEFSDRYADFGIWTQPDPCAPPDGNWSNYGITFGPDGDGGCILDTDSSDGIGRAPGNHGANRDSGYYGSSFANKMWNAYRGPVCSDGICNGNETYETCPTDCCLVNDTKNCYTGPNGTEDVGICHNGTQTCLADGSWGACEEEQTPQTEICGNGIDEDCNGIDLACPPEGIPEGYIAWYKFEGNANDETGNNDGSLISGSYFDDAERGWVLDLDGDGDYVDVPDKTLTANWTINFWANGSGTLFGTRNLNNNDILLQSGSFAGFYNSIWPTWVAWSGDTGFSSRWRHYAFVANENGDGIKFYIDGVSQGGKAIQTSFLFSNIGYAAQPTYKSNFNGQIDEVMIFDRALSAQEIQDIYDTQKPAGNEAMIKPSENEFFLKNLASILSSIQSAAQEIVEKIKSLF